MRTECGFTLVISQNSLQHWKPLPLTLPPLTPSSMPLWRRRHRRHPHHQQQPLATKTYLVAAATGPSLLHRMPPPGGRTDEPSVLILPSTPQQATLAMSKGVSLWLSLMTRRGRPTWQGSGDRWWWQWWQWRRRIMLPIFLSIFANPLLGSFSLVINS